MWTLSSMIFGRMFKEMRHSFKQSEKSFFFCFEKCSNNKMSCEITGQVGQLIYFIFNNPYCLVLGTES